MRTGGALQLHPSAGCLGAMVGVAPLGSLPFGARTPWITVRHSRRTPVTIAGQDLQLIKAMPPVHAPQLMRSTSLKLQYGGYVAACSNNQV